MLALLIVVHEAAISSLPHSRAFASAFPLAGPALIKRQRRGVTYALRLLPLGGFVAFPDDDEETRSLLMILIYAQPADLAGLVVAAGVLANLALALVVLFAQAAIVGVPAARSRGPRGSGATGWCCRPLGLRAGDQILSLNDQPLAAGQQGVAAMVRDVCGASGATRPQPLN